MLIVASTVNFVKFIILQNVCLVYIKYSVLFTTMLGVFMKCLGIHTKTSTALKLQVV